MFAKTAGFYDLAYGFKQYAEEAVVLRKAIAAHNPDAHTLLDVACGTGKHLELFQEDFTVEGLDLDDGLLAIARERLPDVPVHRGDMRSFALDRRFDVVTCLFSSIAYMTTVEDLRAATATMAAHLEPRGVLLIEPFLGPDDWKDRHTSMLTAEDDGVQLARGTIAGRQGRVAFLDFHYLVVTPDGAETIHERHEIGLFTPEEYRGAFHAVGLDVEHDPDGPMGRGLYIGVSGA